jgi:integrase
VAHWNLHLKPILARAGLPRDTRFYDLRQTCALLLLVNINPKIASERPEHSTVTFTLDTYSHLLPRMQRAVADQLEQMLFG